MFGVNLAHDMLVLFLNLVDLTPIQNGSILPEIVNHLS
jgi:hypothetical protein